MIRQSVEEGSPVYIRAEALRDHGDRAAKTTPTRNGMVDAHQPRLGGLHEA